MVELSKHRSPHGFNESVGIAKRCGEVAHGDRRLIEKELGHSVISQAKASDYLTSEEDIDVQALPEDSDR